MVAAVAVEDIDGMDLVKIMLEGIGREDAGDAGIKAGAKNGGQASLAEFLAVGPLPAIIEVGSEALLLEMCIRDRLYTGNFRFLIELQM